MGMGGLVLMVRCNVNEEVREEWFDLDWIGLDWMFIMNEEEEKEQRTRGRRNGG